MAFEVIPMDIKIRVAVADSSLNVRAWCRAHQVSKSAFYKWKLRYALDGLEGLAERSRRPLNFPSQTAATIEDDIVRLRKELGDAGLDAGADTIRWHLERTGVAVPSAATVWRILVRRGLVIPEPRKRPRSSWRSFERARPNECWQIDATKWELTNGKMVEIIDIIDDHSRVVVAARAVPIATAVQAWATFCDGANRWGLPAEVLSDNGAPFVSVLFTTNLHHCQINTINSRPYHPQTCGKIERFHETLKRRLNKQPRARTLHQLQTQLDQFLEIYNHHRPHRSIGRSTPSNRWHATPPATPAGVTIRPATPIISQRTITCVGVLELFPWRINVGKHHAGKLVTVYHHHPDVLVFHNGTVIHTRTINTNQHYQPSQRVRDVSRHTRPR
jgi:transposase InsO family protein